MKLSLALAIASVTVVSADIWPRYQWDPRTIKHCTEWRDVDGSLSCEDARRFYGFTPELFHEYNPSVGLDCKPWNMYQSYCIITKERAEEYAKTWTISHAATESDFQPPPPPPSPTPRPKPTGWKDMGCYPFNRNETRGLWPMTPLGGDKQMTVAKCQQKCHSMRLDVAVLANGNECWCSDWELGNIPPAEVKCDIPCAGDSKVICGGKDCVSIFKLMGYAKPGDDDEAVTNSASFTSVAASVASTTTSDSAAMKNLRPFWL